jgi:hypothetical protein
MSDYAIAPLGEIEEIDDGRSPFRAVRHHFGITSFGVNAFIGRDTGDRIINEHDEEGENEELYLVHTGRARFELDGESVDAPAGTFVFARPGVKRTAFAEEPGTTLVALGGTPGEAYQPSGYELWAPVRPLYEAGNYEAVADRISATIGDHPYPFVFYNLACVESLSGRKDDAIAHLARAIELSEQFRGYAAGDSDFDAIRDEPGFQRLIEA